jgi:hypothetical protein
MGVHWRNKYYYNFTVEVKDYCWITRIIEKPDSYYRLQNMTARSKEQAYMPFAPF